MADYLNIGYIEILSGGAGNPRVFAGVVDPSAGAGVPAQEGSLFQRFGAGAGQLWLKTGAADTAWTQLTAGAAGSSAVLGWGNSSIAANADTRFLDPWYNQGVAPLVANDVVAPRSGTLRNLFVRHNVASGNGALVVYALAINGVPTLVTATLASGAVGQASDTINTAIVLQGQRVSLSATKPLSIGNGTQEVTATVEFV